VQNWIWVIPRTYAAYIAELERENHPIYDELLRLQQSESGTLRYTFELFPNVFLMRIHRHRIIYERMTTEKQLLLTSIERMG
jgi:hypothetical protein